MYKKIILPIMFLILLTTVFAYENYHAYNESQFGNIQVQMGTDGAEAFGTVNNITLCVESVAPMDGYVNSFYFEGDTYVTSNDYCINTEVADPNDGYWNGFYTVITGCDTNVSGTMLLDTVENVTNYLNYKFYEGEQFYFCMQEPTNAGSMQLDTFQTNSFVIDEGNETWDVVQQPLLNDLKQWKVSTAGQGLWYHSNTVDWHRGRNKFPQKAQFCMKPSEFEDEVCYTIAGQEQNRYQYSCGALDDKVGEKFQWHGNTGTIINKIDLWMYSGTLTPSNAEFKIGLDHIDISDNTTTNIYLSGVHNYSELNGSGIRKVTEETLLPTMALTEDEYYLLYFTCTQGCSDPSTTNGVCSAFNWYHADPYFEQGFQSDTGRMFLEGISGAGYVEYSNRDMNFLLTTYEGDIWGEDVADPTNLTDCPTNCTTWSGSSYLKEDFNGDVSTCDWAVNDYYCWDNQIITDKTYDFYSIFKTTDLKYGTDSRYFTVSFDIKPADIEADGYVSLSLYDVDFTKYVNVLFGDNNKFYNNENGNAIEYYSNMSSGTTKNMKLHIDLTDDDFDVYYDGSLIVSSLEFVDEFYNMDNIYGFRLSSLEAGYVFENLEIYASNQDNVRTAVDGDIPLFEVDEDKSWCGYFTRSQPTCTQDSDCETDECLPSGKCASFDFTYCDDNGKKRGNMCMASAMTSCVLESTGEIILDNFFLFLVFLIMIMGLVYLVIMLKN